MEKQFKLPKDFAEKWIADLRSGKYKQATGTLFNGEGYCCLGVACMTAGYTTDDLRLEESDNGYAAVITTTNTISEFSLKEDLPNVPEEIKGISRDSNLVSQLTGMNDDGQSFEQIADWIEKNVEFY